MASIFYRLYGLIHLSLKSLLRRNKLSIGPLTGRILPLGCDLSKALMVWSLFVKHSTIHSDMYAGLHYAGYIAESKEWCLPNWVWTNAASVRMFCSVGDIDKAIALGNILERSQHDSGGWVVRYDYDSIGAYPVLAPNDSAYIANNAFLSLYKVTREDRYLRIAVRCADWIINTARPDGLVHTGYNMRDEKWDTSYVIVDIGFTAGFFATLYELTGDNQYKEFLQRFVCRYSELFYLPSKKGFCTSIDSNNCPRGGMFSRGQAWALEGLIPSYRVLKNDTLKSIIEETISNLIVKQNRGGGWPYNLTRKLMGEDCKAVSVIAKNMMDWFVISGEEKIVKSANKALEWCCRHTANRGDAIGGIFSYSIEGAIVKNLYTSCAFVYASAYAIELEKLFIRWNL